MRTDESQLVERAAIGDDDAFVELMNRYRDAVCAIAYSYLGSFEDVQDVAQEAFVQAYSQLKCLREPERFGAWLRRIATNCAASVHRRRRSAVSLEQVEESVIPASSREAEQTATRVVVQNALAQLSEKARITTTLFYINGYSHSEIANLLEVPVNTVRSRLQTARRQLSEEMTTMVKQVLHEEKQKVALEIGKHTLRAEPIEKTGDRDLDKFLFSLTSVLEIGFGDYIRSVYLVKTFVPVGFLTLAILMKDEYSDSHRWRAWSLVDHVKAISATDYRPDPLYLGRETPFYAANDFGDENLWPCMPIIKLMVKDDSLLLWGEDIRERIAVPDEVFVRKDVLIPPLNHIKQTHYAKPDGSSALDEVIVYPLNDPAPGAPDRGHGDPWRFVMQAARALVYLRTGKLLFDREELIAEFTDVFGEQWAGFVAKVLRFVEDRSEDEREKARLEACRHMTAFKNYFLEQVSAQGVDVSEHVRIS